MTNLPSKTTTLKLADFLNVVSEVVRDTVGDPVWVQAEIVRAEARSKGYWILEIQDTDNNGKKTANASVMVWYREVPAVIYYFKRATGQDLGPGMKVLLQVKASFSPEWGFRLTAQAIDPTWTIGQLQQKITQIKEALSAQGIWLNNKKLPTPREFTKVAVIAPDMSAGLGDFWKEAQVLEANGLCKFVVYKAAFEGNNARREIVLALAQVIKNQPVEQYDAVLLLRGGGASTGIQSLNEEIIVKSVCLCPIPVIVGIGHEKDQTLLDEVANVSLGTPSKVAGLIVQTIVSNASQADQAWQNIQHQVSAKLGEVNYNLKQLWSTVCQEREKLLQQAREAIQEKWLQAVNLGPEATLKRGYAVIEQGKTVITKQTTLVNLKNDQNEIEGLGIWLADGKIQGRMTIESIEPAIKAKK